MGNKEDAEKLVSTAGLLLIDAMVFQEIIILAVWARLIAASQSFLSGQQSPGIARLPAAFGLPDFLQPGLNFGQGQAVDLLILTGLISSRISHV